ncbi:MAG: four helix bundle protein [Phycisphaerae bacterium]
MALAERVLALADRLPNNTKGWVVGKQLIRCGTSVGANIREADNALTDAEFSNKCSIARKEASETYYWLELCQRAGILSGDVLIETLREADEITRVLSTIVRRTQCYIGEKHE